MLVSVALLVVVDVAADRFGADSRPGFLGDRRN
jgi:hypothetical protein